MSSISIAMFYEPQAQSAIHHNYSPYHTCTFVPTFDDISITSWFRTRSRLNSLAAHTAHLSLLDDIRQGQRTKKRGRKVDARYYHYCSYECIDNDGHHGVVGAKPDKEKVMVVEVRRRSGRMEVVRRRRKT
jgi:hypothetical protein